MYRLHASHTFMWSLLGLLCVFGCDKVVGVEEPSRAECQADETRCIGDVLETCEDRSFVSTETCEYGCGATGCLAAENEEEQSESRPQGCTEEDTQCDGNTAERCQNGELVRLACTYGCQDGECLAPTCTQGQIRCGEAIVNPSLYTCASDGEWELQGNCKGTCSDEFGCISCESGDLRCNGGAMYSCEDGEYVLATSCPFACDVDCGGYPVGLWEVQRSCEATGLLVEAAFGEQDSSALSSEVCPEDPKQQFSVGAEQPRVQGIIEIWPDGTVVSGIEVARDILQTFVNACIPGPDGMTFPGPVEAATAAGCEAWQDSLNQATQTGDASIDSEIVCNLNGVNCQCRTPGAFMGLGLPPDPYQSFCVQNDSMNFRTLTYGISQLTRAAPRTTLIRAQQPEELANYGTALAASGDTLVIGSNGQGLVQGFVEVFVRDNDGYRFQARLEGHNTELADYFGTSVAISGDRIAVGALTESSGEAGVNGTGDDNSTPEAGAVYLFTRSGETWQQEAYLKASNPDPYDQFGGYVALEGDRLLVGAGNESSGVGGVNRSGEDNSVEASGAAYVFELSPDGWAQTAYLKPETPQEGGWVGMVVALSGDTAAVSSLEMGEDNLPSSGRVHVFVVADGEWHQQATLEPEFPQEKGQFGWGLSLTEDLLVVGAPKEDSTTAEPAQDTMDTTFNSGAVYVFERSGDDWAQSGFFKAPKIAQRQLFGTAVAVARGYRPFLYDTGAGFDTIAVGAVLENVEGPAGEEPVEQAGAVHVYRRHGTNTAFEYYRSFTAPQPGTQDYVGQWLTFAGTGIAASAIGDDGSSGGVFSQLQGTEAELLESDTPDSGAVYVFQ